MPNEPPAADVEQPALVGRSVSTQVTLGSGEPVVEWDLNLQQDGAALSVVAKDSGGEGGVEMNIESSFPVGDASLRLSAGNVFAENPDVGMGVTAQVGEVLVTADLGTAAGNVAASATGTAKITPELTLNAGVNLSEEVSAALGISYAAEDGTFSASVQGEDIFGANVTADVKADAQISDDLAVGVAFGLPDGVLNSTIAYTPTEQVTLKARGSNLLRSTRTLDLEVQGAATRDLTLNAAAAAAATVAGVPDASLNLAATYARDWATVEAKLNNFQSVDLSVAAQVSEHLNVNVDIQGLPENTLVGAGFTFSF
ncbi:hypothetical protein BH24DEI2_BH24DEI2_14300 [soil metagenome]